MQRCRRTQVLAAIVVATLAAMDRSATSATAQPFKPNFQPPSSATNPPTRSSSPSVEPGYLGVVADENGQNNGGIRLIDVVAGGPAQAAGLRPGDVITSIDGQTANSVDDMANLMAGRPEGDEVTFVVRRGNEVSRIEVRLTKRPPPEQRRLGTFGRNTPNGAAPPSNMTSSTGAHAPTTTMPSSIPSYTPRPTTEPLPDPTTPQSGSFRATSPLAGVPESKALLGVRAVPIVPELQRSLNLPEARGALIVEVQPGSPAQKAGLPLEAVVVGIDGLPINSPQELAVAVSERGAGTDVRLSYFRFGQLTEKMIRLGVGPSPAGVSPPTALTPVAPRTTVPPAVLPTTPRVPVAPPPAVLPKPKPETPTVSAESEADKLRRQIREMEARLSDIEKQKSTNLPKTPAPKTTPPAKKP